MGANVAKVINPRAEAAVKGALSRVISQDQPLKNIAATKTIRIPRSAEIKDALKRFLCQGQQLDIIITIIVQYCVGDEVLVLLGGQIRPGVLSTIVYVIL